MSSSVLTLRAVLGLDSSEYDKGLKDARTTADDHASSFKRIFGDIAKVTVGAFAAAASGIALMTKEAVNSYKDYEQLWGGVQKLYGDAADSLKQYAEQAYMTSGMSTNQYMETATSFSAALLKSLKGDAEEAANVTDIAMRAISDNVNTFGTSMDSVSAAFMALSKNNYTLIDNLKLGYAGTAQGMVDLINDSGVLGKTLKSTSDLATVGFDKMVLAIQKIQEQQGIAGTTAKEAMLTIEGSANAAKAAWQNVITAVGRGEGVKEAVQSLITSLVGENEGEGFINQLTKGIKQAFDGIGELVSELAPVIIEKVPELIAEIAPGLFKATADLLSKLFNLIKSKVPDMVQRGIDFMSNLGKGLVEGIPELLSNVLPIIEGMTAKFHDYVGMLVDTGLDLLLNLVQGLMNALPELIKWVPQIVINIADTINDNMPKILATAWEIVKTIIKGIIDAIPDLIANAGKIVEAIWKTITAINWINLGGKILTGIIGGIKNLFGSIGSTMKDVAKTAWDNFKNGMNWKDLGKNIIDGIKNGIVDKAKSLATSVVDAAKNALNAVKGFLGIKSPSKLFKDQIGKNMALGLAQGFEDFMPVDDMVDAVKDAVGDINEASLDGFDNSDVASTEETTTNNSTVSDFGGITINIYGEDKSITEIAQEVSDVLDRQINGLRRAYR